MHIRQIGVVPNVIRRQQVSSGIQILFVSRVNPVVNYGILLFYRHPILLKWATRVESDRSLAQFAALGCS
jgi:hypothetical protein